MKKIFAILLMAAMTLCGFTAFAAEEDLDIAPNTAVVFLDHVEYIFEIELIDDSEEQGLVLQYSSESGEVLAIILDREAVAGEYYSSEEVPDDVFGVGMLMTDGDIYTSTCSETSIATGNPCDVGFTAFNDNGWYQGVAVGTAISNNTGATCDIVMAFDVRAEAEVEEEEEEYFTTNVAEVNIGGYNYIFELYSTDTESGAFAMFVSDETGCQFAVAVNSDFAPGVYEHCMVDDDVFYCAFIDSDGSVYFGECGATVNDEFAPCTVVIETCDDNGLYQIGFIGEMINAETGNVMEVAGFADFTVE